MSPQLKESFRLNSPYVKMRNSSFLVPLPLLEESQFLNSDIFKPDESRILILSIWNFNCCFGIIKFFPGALLMMNHLFDNFLPS